MTTKRSFGKLLTAYPTSVRLAALADTNPATANSEDRSAEATPQDGRSAIHPYRAAWQTRDIQAWGKALAPDLVMHSPVVSKPFIGRGVAIDLFGALFGAVGDFRITDELVSADGHAFFWQADYRGKTIKGADLVRTNDQGLVSEITVLIRPLVGIAIFGSALGPPLASKHSWGRAAIVRLLNTPLALIFGLIDKVASRLLVPR